MSEPVGPTTPAALVEAAYARYPERVAIARDAARPPADVRREGAHRARRRSRDRRVSTAVSTTPTTGPTASRCRTRPRRWRCCSSCSPDSRPSRCRRPCTATTSSRRASAPTPTCRSRSTPTREVYEFLRTRVGEVRHRLLEAGQRDHPPGRARELRVPGRDDDRHRLAHAERGRARHDRDRRRRRRRGRRDGGLAVQHARAEAHRRAAHRRALGLGGAEGRHPRRSPASSP